MSEAYLFASILIPAAENPLAAIARKSGLRADRIEALHRFDALEQPEALPIPILDWSDSPLQAHFTLQAICAGLVAGQRELVALAQTAGGQTIALLLGGPAPVGRYNLLPLARFHLLPAFPGGLAGFELASAYALTLLPEGLRFSHLAGDFPAEAHNRFNPGMVLPQARGALFQLGAMLESRVSWGIWFSRAAGAVLATVVEGL